MIEGVLFDMDGVLFDTERLGLAGWKLAGTQLGLDIDEEFVSRLRGRNVADSRAYYQQATGRDDYEAARAIRVAYSDAIIARDGLPVKPGVHTLLEALRTRGIPAALATGTARERAVGYLKEAGIDCYFSATVCGDEVTHAKPDPEIFLRAAAQLGLPPAHCMAVEDSPNGLAAARAAGCVTVMLPDLTPPSETLAPLYDACVSSLADIIPLL